MSASPLLIPRGPSEATGNGPILKAELVAEQDKEWAGAPENRKGARHISCRKANLMTCLVFQFFSYTGQKASFDQCAREHDFRCTQSTDCSVSRSLRVHRSRNFF